MTNQRTRLVLDRVVGRTGDDRGSMMVAMMGILLVTVAVPPPWA